MVGWEEQQTKGAPLDAWLPLRAKARSATGTYRRTPVPARPVGCFRFPDAVPKGPLPSGDGARLTGGRDHLSPEFPREQPTIQADSGAMRPPPQAQPAAVPHAASARTDFGHQNRRPRTKAPGRVETEEPAVAPHPHQHASAHAAAPRRVRRQQCGAARRPQARGVEAWRASVPATMPAPQATPPPIPSRARGAPEPHRRAQWSSQAPRPPSGPTRPEHCPWGSSLAPKLRALRERPHKLRRSIQKIAQTAFAVALFQSPRPPALLCPT